MTQPYVDPLYKLKQAKNIAAKPLGQLNSAELDKAEWAHEHVFQHQNRLLNYAKSASFKNAAIYTPAISDGYIANVSRLAASRFEAEEQKNPVFDPLHGFAFDAEDLQFINPKSKLFFYPWILFSGGQGARTEAAALQDNWVTRRPRDSRVVVIGDSGGFQIQQQTIEFDPVLTPERMLTWLERVADQSMILDFPTGGISSGAMEPHVQRLENDGVSIRAMAKTAKFSSGFMACLHITCENNKIFQAKRVAEATKFLNVIQGRNEAESAYWYQAVKHFPFEGWAFAGKHSTQLAMTLRRLIQMRDDGLLRRGQFIHFLGVSTMSVGVALTFIQRTLRRKTDAKDVQLTFDSKSPVDSVINGYQSVSGYDFHPDKWSFHTERTNLTEYAASDVMLGQLAKPWAEMADNRKVSRSTLGYILRMKDLVAKPNPITGKRVPNAVQQTLLIHHNTQAYIEGFRAAYKRLDDTAAMERAHAIQTLNFYIRKVFVVQNPMSLIDQLKIELDGIALDKRFKK